MPLKLVFLRPQNWYRLNPITNTITAVKEIDIVSVVSAHVAGLHVTPHML